MRIGKVREDNAPSMGNGLWDDKEAARLVVAAGDLLTEIARIVSQDRFVCGEVDGGVGGRFVNEVQHF